MLSASGITLVEPKTTLVAGEGYFRVTLDGGNEQTGSQTTFTYTSVSNGTHTLKAELVKSNGSSFDPPIASTVTFSVEKPIIEQAAPFAFPADMATYAIVGVIIIVIIGGAYFAISKRGEFSMPHISRRTTRQFTDRLGDVSTRLSRRRETESFSRGYEYRGESNYSSYNPDTVESSGTPKDKNDLDE